MNLARAIHFDESDMNVSRWTISPTECRHS